MSTSEIATVLAWHDALNSGDIDTLLSLSSDDIEMGRPTSWNRSPSRPIAPVW